MKEINLLKRGITKIIFEEELIAKLSRDRPLRIKLGIDPTTPDLHLGHTVLLQKLRQFQNFGHTAVLIIGDFTAKIGDPSGQSETRPILSEEEIIENAKCIKSQIFKILNPSKTEVVYNSEWLFKIFQPKNLTELHTNLRNFFGVYTVQRLLERDDFTKRQKEGKPISVLEMMYPLFQGYDSVAVKSDIEIGGTDQLFNLLLGRDMQRNFGLEPQVVITLPLLVGTDGSRKMSKTYGNYIGLNEEPKEIYGKIMSIDDETMYTYYELLTDFSLDEIKKLHPKDAKSKLAFEIVARYCGKDEAKKAQVEFEKIFSQKEYPSNIAEISVEKKEMILADILVLTGLARSKKSARRLIEQGAIEVNRKKIVENKKIDLSDGTIIKVGKRKFCKIRIH